MVVATKPNLERKPVRELKHLRRTTGEKSSGSNRCSPPCHVTLSANRR